MVTIDHVVIVVNKDGNITCGVFNYDAGDRMYDRFYIKTNRWTDMVDLIQTIHPKKISIQPSKF